MSNIKVAVRVRPFNKKEKDEGSKEIVQVKGDTVSIENVKLLGISDIADSRERIKHFMFDHCYDCMAGDTPSFSSSQAVVFEDLGSDVLRAAFDGFNACVFAYGQTGTGKTYTMMGEEGDVGLIPRICESLFSHVDDCADDKLTCRIDISYYEIYNERVRDLLQPELLKQNEKYSLKVREHPKEGPYVKDLSWHRVKDNDEIQALLDTGNDYRVTAETYMHDHSSRSHAIVTICFTQARLEENQPSEIVSKVHLVDLAGSERADPSSKPGFRKRLTEGANINRSLVTLGYVIKALAEKSLLSWSIEDMGSIQNFQSSGGGESMASNSPSGPNKQRLPYIPYRDSVLTWLLKDSLGGNSKTIMIATITPASQYYNETISTLRYAQRAKNIINKPRVNEDSNVALIRELRKEIERLHSMLADAQSSGGLLTLPDTQDSMIAEKLHENEEMAKQLTQSWMCKWSSTHDIMKESDLSIRGLHNRTSSMGVMIDSQLPYLVAMDDDILSTGVCIFHLKEGETLIGREDADREQDIVLAGPHILKEHCFIQNLDGIVTLVPCLGAMCAVQGIEVTEPKQLSQGDFLVLSGNQVFRFNNPTEAAKLREHRRSQGSLTTLSTSHLSFGGLSRASSYNSIMSEDPSYLSPHSQYLKSSYPKRRHSDHIVLDLERRYKTENERIEEARAELQKLRDEHEKSEELRQEEEERMYQLHDQHRQEIEDQRRHLAQLIEENQRARQKAEEELELARESLAKEKEAFQKQLNEERARLKQLRNLEKQESLAVQTDPLQTSSIATDPDLEVFSQGTQGDELKPKYSGGRKLSAEEQLQELEVMEFERKLSYRETEESLSIQQEDLEDQYNSTQDQIEAKMEKIKKIEEQYKELDKAHLQEISVKKEKLDDLRKKESELEVYIEEKEELMKVRTDLPRPLRNASSEMFLSPHIEEARFPQKTTSLSDIQADVDTEAGSGQKTPLSASSESLKSPINSVAMDYSMENVDQEKEKNKPKTEAVKRKQKSDDKLSKITGVARDVTSRLYQPPEPKFKYVPKSKEKEVKPVPTRTRPPRERDPDAIGRGSPSPSRAHKDLSNRHSPSPLRNSPSPLRHSPSPSRGTGRKVSPSLAREKGKQPDSSTTVDKNRQTISKKLNPKKDSKSKADVEVGSRTDRKESPIMAVRNKSHFQTDSGSALKEVKMRKPPDRLGVLPNRLGGMSPLRQMASASSLASVPESLNEEDNGPLGSPRLSEPVVKKRTRRGRALMDDDFRSRSAPDYDKLENEFNAYSKEMMGFLPGEGKDVIVSPSYEKSVSVDESALSGFGNQEEENGSLEENSSKDTMTVESLACENTLSQGKVLQNQAPSSKFYVSSGDEMTCDETDSVTENKQTTADEMSVLPSTVQDTNCARQLLELDDIDIDMRTSHGHKDDVNSDTVLIGEKRDHNKNTERDENSSPVKKSKLASDEECVDLKESELSKTTGKGEDTFSDDSLDADQNSATSDQEMEATYSDRLTQSLPHDYFSESYNYKSEYDDSHKNPDLHAKVAESEINVTDNEYKLDQNTGVSECQTPLAGTLAVEDSADISELLDSMNDNEEPERFIVTLDIQTNKNLANSLSPVSVSNDPMKLAEEKIINEASTELQAENKPTKSGGELTQRPENVNIVSVILARDMENELKVSKNKTSLDPETLKYHEELKVKLALEGETKLTHEELELILKLEGESCVLAANKKQLPSAEVKMSESEATEMIADENELSCNVEGINSQTVHNSVIDAEMVDKESKMDVNFQNENEISNVGDNMTSETSGQINKKLDGEIVQPDEIKFESKMEQISDNHQPENLVKPMALDSGDRDGISATEILTHSRSLAVWTSQEYLADFEATGDGNVAHCSDDSTLDPGQELQELQEALEQLPSKSSSKDGPQLSTARRAARQRAMIRNELRTTDSDGVSAQSDESPTSGNPSKSSSRPGSGSRRRRRPNGRGLALTVTEHTTDEYASSESDSLYSDDSLTECNHRSGGQIDHGNPDVGNGPVDNSRVADLESSEVEPSDMLSPHSKEMRRRRQSPRQNNQTNGADVSTDGTRTVGIQTLGRSDRVHSGGSTRTDTSEELNISFASGDYSSLGRNMGVSPLSLWANDRQDSDSFSDKNSTSSAGVKVHLNDMDRSMTPTPRSSARSSCSFFSDKSNLDKGPTEVWSSSASDLRPVRGFREDLMFKMETEGTYPGQASLDSEDAQSQRSLNVRTPVEEEGLTQKLECSTPTNAAKVVHVTFPEGQLVKSEAFSVNVPVKYQVTIHEDNTNIMYNVDKTEYKTYSLRNQSDIQPSVIPDTIHVNLTESITSETHDKFESNSKEDISFHKADDKHEPEEDSLILERSFRSSCSSERELLAESGAIPQETFKELTEKTEQQSCFQVPSTKLDYSKRKKPSELHQTGIIANSVYPGADESVVGDDGEPQVQSDGGNVLNESDTTSDYGTFTSVDGRKGLVSFTSDSEEGDSGTMSPSASPKTSHKLSDKVHSDRVSPWFHDRYKQLPEQGSVLEASEENIQTLPVQGQSLCSVQDTVNPSVIAARVHPSSPTQLVCNQTHTLGQKEIDYNENSVDNTLKTRANMPQNSHLVETDINLPIIVNGGSNRNEEIDNDSGSRSTLERKDSNENESKMSSRETLESVETIQYDSDDNTTKLDNQICKHPNQHAEHNDRSVSSEPPVFSPKQLRDLTSPISSADDVYLSLEKLETSTSSSDYHTPQQSPRNDSEAVVSRLVTDVEIPDISSNVSSASPTPREGIANEQKHESPKSNRTTDMRTVSVNTEAVSLVSHSPAITQQTFFDENDPAYTEKMRKELEKKIATLKHKERSLSDSAISSDYTDCDSSPRGSRFYDIDKQISGSHFRHSAMHGNHQAIYHTVQSPNHESKKVNFDALSVKKSLFTDSGNVYDHDDEEKVMKGATEQGKEKKKEINMSNNDQSKDNKNGQHALPTYATELKLHYIPTAVAVETFPERLADAILAIKPHPYPRSVSLDGLSALVNIDTHLSRAVRNMPVKEQVSKESQMSSLQNQNVTHDLKGKSKPLSSDYELKVNKCADKLRGKSTSLSELDPVTTKKVHKSFSEANIDDFEENDTSSSSSDSITFVFVNKNDQDIEGVMNIENADICLQDANGYDQEHTQDYLYQNNYDPYSEYSASESQSPDSRPISGMAPSGTESEDYSLSESQSPDSRPISGLAPSGTGSDDYAYEVNQSGKIIYLDGFPGGLQSEEVLGRTNSRPSTSCEVDILDQSSTHSGSEEIEEIVNINGDQGQMGGSREICFRQNTVSPPTYTDPSDDQTHSDGLDQNVTNSMSADEKPLRHKFGIDESVLPIPERAVSADNLPKHKIKFKDIQRSRSADMLEVGDSNEQESEEGIFPPAIQNVDDDPTDPSISLRTMSDGGIDHVSHRTVSELGVTYSSRTSSELDSVTSTSESSVAKVKAAHGDADSSSESSYLEEEYQEEIIIEYGKAYETDKLPDYNYGELPVYNTSRKSPSTASEGEVDPATFQDDEHIREVLRTVEKFIMPKQVLVDHGTSMTDESCLKYVSVGVQTSSLESSTQTTETSPIHVNPDQILLPALAAPFRSQSMDSFGLGINEQKPVLSEGSNNWCTLGELMIETTNLLRRINERLPDIENKNALPSSEESQAILQKWQEISVQTGYSLADLTTVGLQTDESLTGLGKLLSGPGKNAESTAESTQVDTGFKMEPLDVSETITSELIPGPAETISCEISIQTDPGTSDISVLETVEMSIKPNETSDAEKYKEIMERSEAIQDQDAVHYKRETKVNVPSDIRTSSEPGISVRPLDKSYGDKFENKENIQSRQISFSSAPKSDTKDSVLPANSTTQPHVFETPIYRSRQMSTPLKQKVTLSNEPTQSIESDSGNHDAKLPASTPVLSANSTEIEELRKEHAKLIENLRNASAGRKERQNKVKARKHNTTDLINNEPSHANESSILKESLPESLRKEQQTNKINGLKERSVKEDSKPSKAKSVSPQEFIKVNIQMDPSTGIIVDNTTYKSHEAGTLVEEEKIKGTVHEQTWQLSGDQIMIVSEEKPDLSSDRSRTESDTSLSSGGTTESEIVSVMAGHDNMADPAEYAAVRAGALNPLFKDETDIIGDVLGEDVLNPESAEKLYLNPVTEKMTKRLVLKPEIFYGDFAEKYTDSEKLDILQAGKIKKPENENIKSENKENAIPEEERIVPKHHKRDNALPTQFPGKPMYSRGSKDKSSSEVSIREPSIDLLEKNIIKQQDIVKSETSPKLKSSALHSIRIDRSDPGSSVSSTIKYGPGYSNATTLSASVSAAQPLVTSSALSPDRHLAAPRFGHSDDSTQMSMEFSDDFTQTDPDTSAETIIHVETRNDKSDGKDVITGKIVPAKAHSVSSMPARARPEVSNSMTRELERLQNERGDIMELLSLNYLPTSLTVELLEAKLNYCIGQTDLLLGSLDDNFRPSDKSKGTAIDQQFAKEYITKYRADLKKSKQDILMCRERLQKGRVIGSGRGRSVLRNRDLFHDRRLAQIEAFKLERLREQQDYQRSRCSTPIKGNTPLRGNTPLKGNSPIATPRSNISRDSSPDYSPAYMTPKEHKVHYGDLRKQLIKNVLEEERKHTRSCSPTLLGHHPDNRNLDASFGFSPKISVSVSNGMDREDISTYVVAPGTYVDSSPRTNSVDRYPHLTASYYQHPHHHVPSHHGLDTRTTAESIFSPQESEQILREIRQIQERTQMSAPIEETIRTSSFSSSTHSHRSLDSSRGGLSPRGQSDMLGPRNRSLSPAARHSDTSLGLNLDYLHDSRHSDLEDTRPYSPYSAYAREHIIPSERLQDGGILRGSFELYDSLSHERSHERSHDRSHDTLSVVSQESEFHRDSPARSSLNEQRVSRLRPIRSADIKARLSRHKR